MKFKKSPAYIGKYLSLYVSGGDRSVGDHDILEGAQWSKFVGLGMLVQIPEDPPKPQPAPKPFAHCPPAAAKPVVEEAKTPTSVPEPEPIAETVMESDESTDGTPDGTTKSPMKAWGRGRRRKSE